MHTSAAVTPLEATYAASTEGLAQALSEFDRLSAANAWSSRLAHSLRLVLEELIINVVTHGRRPGDTGWFSVRFTLRHDSIVLVIEDDGLPFDPTAAPAPDLDAPLDDRPVGGLGLFLARSLSDELRYVREHGMNRTTAIFLAASHHD
ncbi:MAG: ATP-binding protein [Betaproteobacteria bacterium]|nr:ATP-binding protein [Betaproteobacteria bacterium]